MSGFPMPRQFGDPEMNMCMGRPQKEPAIVAINANKKAYDEFKILQEKVSKLQSEMKTLNENKKEQDARNIKMQIEPLEKKMRELRSKFETLDVTPYDDIRKFPDEMKTYTWIKTLRAVRMDLQTAENIPESVLNINLEGNKISVLGKGHLSKKCLRLEISHNRISVLENLPENLLGLEAARTGIEKVDEKCIPDCLESMNLTDNKLKEIGKLGHVKMLDLSHNEMLGDISELNNEIVELDCSHCAIKTIEEGKFPPKVVKLIAFKNPLSCVKTLQASLRIVDISYCELKEFPKLCNGLEQLDISHNSITTIPDPENDQNAYPVTLYKLDISHNPCKTPKKLKDIIRTLIGTENSNDQNGQMGRNMRGDNDMDQMMRMRMRMGMGMGMDMDDNTAERLMMMNATSSSGECCNGSMYRDPNYIPLKKSIVL